MEIPDRKSSRIREYDYSASGAYFITVCTENRAKILSKITGIPGEMPDSGVELLQYGMIAEKYIRQMDDFYDHLSVDKYVIMPDHIHLLITLHDVPGSEKDRLSAIARFVGSFKRFCNKEYGRNIWQGRFYDHVIRNQDDYNEVWKYIDNNPTKWVMKKRGVE